MPLEKIDSVLLFGGGELCTQFAEYLLSMNYNTIVFTAERHAKEQVKCRNATFENFLKKNNIKYYLTEDINTDSNLKKHLTKTTLGVCLGPAWNFNEEWISKFDGRLLEFMGIPLPQYRGGAHYSHQIMKKDRAWACYLQQVTKNKHKGPILLQKHYTMPLQARTPQDCIDALSKNGLEFLKEFLQGLKNGKKFEPKPLQEYFSTCFPYLYTDIHGFINWGWEVNEVELFIAAFDEPYKGASTFLNGKRVYLKNCFMDLRDGYFHPFQAGIIYRKQEDGIYVAAKGGAIVVKTLLDEKGNNILSQVNEGDRLHTPVECLEKAMQYKAEYNAKGVKK